MWASIILITFISIPHSSTQTDSSYTEVTSYEDRVCYHDWECRNSSSDQVEFHQNSSFYNTTGSLDLRVYECCGANDTQSTSDYGGYGRDYDYGPSAGACCYKEPMPLWLAILLIFIFITFVIGCCVLCCFVRPKFERLLVKPSVNSDAIQTMAAMKVLSDGSNPLAPGNFPSAPYVPQMGALAPPLYLANYPTQSACPMTQSQGYMQASAPGYWMVAGQTPQYGMGPSVSFQQPIDYNYNQSCPGHSGPPNTQYFPISKA